MLKNFTGGYAFDDALSRVVCIYKLRPPPIAGKLWVPGGFVEDGEDIFSAQAREFKEEAGIITAAEEWFYLQSFVTHSKMIHAFCSVGDKFMAATTQTDEKIEIFSVDEVTKRTDLVPEFNDLLGKALECARLINLYPALRMVA